jgi:mono/diheme cytochrome c family protein
MRIWMAIVALSVGQPWAAAAQEAGDPRAGQRLAREVCAVCHAVERGEADSPRPDAPSFDRIARTPGMTGMALTVALQTSHRTMPNLMFEPTELRDVVAYVLSLKERD